ncbi:VCBS domain-containing protein [Massilia sp. B-10]|nr:VCBS domain-containing protein [Massilia sp. B-10]
MALQSNGQWVYTASSAHNEFVGGTNYSDVFTVTSTDGTTSTITVNILGTNDAAVISTATVNLTETNSVLAASGILSISDVDSAATFVAGTIMQHLRQHRPAGQRPVAVHRQHPHNEFVGGTTYSDVFTVTSTDGTTSTITVNILGTNDAAVISTATVNLTETNSVLAASGILSISDVDSAATFVAGTISLHLRQHRPAGQRPMAVHRQHRPQRIRRRHDLQRCLHRHQCRWHDQHHHRQHPGHQRRSRHQHRNRQPDRNELGAGCIGHLVHLGRRQRRHLRCGHDRRDLRQRRPAGQRPMAVHRQLRPQRIRRWHDLQRCLHRHQRRRHDQHHHRQHPRHQ